MEMKPEYNYDEVTHYHVVLPSNVRANFSHEIQEWLFPGWDWERFKTYFRKSHELKWFDFYDDAEFLALEAKLKQFNMQYTVKKSTQQIVVPPDTVTSARNQFHDSTSLTFLEEYSLPLWAQANSIGEAYRMIRIPAFDEMRIIRVGSHLEVAHKWREHYGYHPEFYPEPPTLHAQQLISDAQKWVLLCAVMRDKLWDASAYDWSEGVTWNDGEVVSFEGWYQGEYKVRNTPNPDKDSLDAQAIDLFYSLLPES